MPMTRLVFAGLTNKKTFACGFAGAAGVMMIAAFPALAQQPAGASSALPSTSQPTGGAVTTITVSGGNRALFKIAVAPLVGDHDTSNTVVDIESRDFTLSSIFQVLDPKSFTANLGAEGTGIDPASWRNVGAEGVVKGLTSMRGSNVHLELRLFVVSRVPARLVVMDTASGKVVQKLAAVGDCDDVFYDERRHRIYAIGGEGGISVFQQRDANHYDELGRIKTVSGARTGYFSAELDKLYVAVRKHGSLAAEIRVFTPAP